jgi:hypothetical protein
MAATTAKPTVMVRWTLEENERNVRKLFFAAAVDIQRQTEQQKYKQNSKKGIFLMSQ